jgi:phage gp36-like protein
MTALCTQAEVERFLSVQGVTAFADHDQDGTADDDVVDDCIEQASEEMLAYLLQRYALASLVSSTLVKRWAVTISAYFLCMRRGNPPPEVLQTEFERLLNPETGLIPRVAAGSFALPGLALNADLVPNFANLTVDRRFGQSKVRVLPGSSGTAPSVIPAKTIYQPPFPEY